TVATPTFKRSAASSIFKVSIDPFSPGRPRGSFASSCAAIPSWDGVRCRLRRFMLTTNPTVLVVSVVHLPLHLHRPGGGSHPAVVGRHVLQETVFQRDQLPCTPLRL